MPMPAMPNAVATSIEPAIAVAAATLGMVAARDRSGIVIDTFV